MATIKPFRGVRYNAAKIPNLSQVVSQPYDRVRYGLQERYYAQHPYNIVRIIKGEELPGDVPDELQGPNCYTRAKAYYELWRAQEILKQDDKPAIYVYQQQFEVAGQRMTRKGLIAALELSEFDEGVVLPHERTHAGPKVDRLRLLRTTGVNLGQIFMLYPDAENAVSAMLDATIAGQSPDVDAVEMFEKDVRQQMWVVDDEATIRAVQAEMAPKRNLIIADGHHRYETALNYRSEMRQAHPDAGPRAAFNYCMVTLVSMQDPGLVILPTHREIFDVPQASGEQVLQRAASTFEITPVADLGRCLTTMEQHTERHAFGLYAENGYHVLTLKQPELIEQLIDLDRSPDWKSLDVSILHNIVLEQVMALPVEALEQQSIIRYHRDPSLAVGNIDKGEGNLVFFLNPTRMVQVQACAGQGEKMPPKSTDFYPKVITGLTMMPAGFIPLLGV
ncbi:MAG: DUF1015 domain-containing protein [Anaerolineae bacterium]|nr:DUF1015 domain-containing protein [Anaerolineae bacterium]